MQMVRSMREKEEIVRTSLLSLSLSDLDLVLTLPPSQSVYSFANVCQMALMMSERALVAHLRKD